MHLRDAYAELGMARELLDQFSYPMLLIDETRGVWHRNSRAHEILQKGNLLREQGGFLVCRNTADDAALVEAIHCLQLADGPSSAPPPRRVVMLHKSDGSTHLAFVSAVLPHQTMGVFGHAARILLVLHDPASACASLDPFIVAECFDLTPAQARVAVQIAEGFSAKEIAKHSGASLATVRTHLQRAMEKTGVERQADLIRTLLALPSRA